MTAHAVLIGLGAAIATGQSEEQLIDAEGAQVLTRGPVHEAFAGLVSYNPEPGVMVEKAPPEAIEEVPPDSRPAGDNISWIPGYWGWDDERSDYLWISGTWRALPPGRQWTTGYWATTGQGHQWISGYWADSSLQETTYLPKPPVTVEAGPNVAAPSRDHAWTPGSWMWQQERYAWRPGYWAQGRPDWDWIPAHYVWTPRGYVFVNGYWDYSFNRRGVLYAPVFFQSGYHSRPGYSYSPVIAIGLAAVVDHLFLRPNYHHYYFGDYYDRGYRDRGYYSPYAYQTSRHGYDPVYSYRRWTHRQDRDWERRHEESYDYRRDHENARPPRTWADHKSFRPDRDDSGDRQMLMAAPFEQLAQQGDEPMRIERVPAKERQKIKEMSREVRKTRERRRTLESEGVNLTSGKNKREIEPTKARLPESPIVGRSPDSFEKKQAPPKPQRSPGVDPKKETPGRIPDLDKTRPESKRQQEPREPDTRKEQRDTHREAVPENQKQQPQPGRLADKPTRKEPPAKTKESKREDRQEPPAKEAKREDRQKPQAKEPKRETRKELQAKEPKRESSRNGPQAKEPTRKTRQEIRQPEKNTRAGEKEESKLKETGKRNEKAGKPSSGRKSEQEKGDSEQPPGKARNKERK